VSRTARRIRFALEGYARICTGTRNGTTVVITKVNRRLCGGYTKGSTTQSAGFGWIKGPDGTYLSALKSSKRCEERRERCVLVSEVCGRRKEAEEWWKVRERMVACPVIKIKGESETS
jgi:hypothetical protein